MANTFRKIYKKTGNSGSTSDYQLVGNVGVNGVELDIMKGASSSADGEIGLVPKPTAGQQNRILTGNGTFQTVKSILTSESLIKNNLTTTTSGSILDAYQGKVLNDKITSTNSTVSSLNSKLTTATSRVSSLESKMEKIKNIHGVIFSISSGRNIYIMDKAYGPAGEDYGFTIRNGSSSHGEFVNDTYWLSVGTRGLSIGLQVNGARNPEWHWVTLSQ